MSLLTKKFGWTLYNQFVMVDSDDSSRHAEEFNQDGDHSNFKDKDLAFGPDHPIFAVPEDLVPKA